MSTIPPAYTVHTFPLWEGMSIREAWAYQSAAATAGSQAVPEFQEAEADGKRHVWVNLRISHEGELLGSYDASGALTTDDLDAPYEWQNTDAGGNPLADAEPDA